MPKLEYERMIGRITLGVVSLMMLAAGSCGGGGGGNLVTVDPFNNNPEPAGTSTAILGRVLDPFNLCASGGSFAGAGICNGLAGPIFPTGSAAVLYSINEQGQLLQPPLGSGSVDPRSSFEIFFNGSLFDPPGAIVQVNNGFETLHGFVITAAVDVSVWSEAIYQLLLSQGSDFTNYTAAEIRDLENILRVKVEISSQSQSLDVVIAQIIRDAEPLIEDLVQICYAPEGNQSDQPCRLQLPLPSPDELENLVQEIVNTGFLIVSGDVIRSNTVTLRVQRL
ncbi:MAG: hypothetical protein HC921_12330 [Synechococcaceae cyanobacterium SM2_3_1]|nr:hypothetical protein [Synechococcaceae cyanobacterium SM2_3_1]